MWKTGYRESCRKKRLVSNGTSGFGVCEDSHLGQALHVLPIRRGGKGTGTGRVGRDGVF